MAEKRISLVLLTNATQYACPGALEGLLAEGHNVACHDASFADVGRRAGFDSRHGKVTTLAGQSPEDIHREVTARCGLPDAIVSNDVSTGCGFRCESAGAARHVGDQIHAPGNRRRWVRDALVT
jgi:hypothetical protein